MKELSLQIEVIPLKGNTHEKSYNFFSNDYYQLQNLKSDSEAGVSFNCNQSIIIDKPSTSVNREFSFPHSCIVRFHESDGNVIQIGSEEIPALVTIVPTLNTASMEIVCNMLYSPLC